MNSTFGIPITDKIIVADPKRPRKPTSAETYVANRIEQLKEDREKAHDHHDKMWYSRLIQELSWVTTRRENCSLKTRGVE